MQLNQLNLEILNKIPGTDSRLRKDIRLLEIQDLKNSESESNRLYEKNKKMKMILLKENQFISRWFKLTEDTKKKTKYYKYNSNYWDSKKSTIIDIF